MAGPISVEKQMNLYFERNPNSATVTFLDDEIGTILHYYWHMRSETTFQEALREAIKADRIRIEPVVPVKRVYNSKS